MPLDQDVDHATGQRVIVRVHPDTRKPVPWSDSFRTSVMPFLASVSADP
jgi:acyl-CoA thioesterase FadM